VSARVQENGAADSLRRTTAWGVQRSKRVLLLVLLLGAGRREWRLRWRRRGSWAGEAVMELRLPSSGGLNVSEHVNRGTVQRFASCRQHFLIEPVFGVGVCVGVGSPSVAAGTVCRGTAAVDGVVMLQQLHVRRATIRFQFHRCTLARAV
jgi:hypothetical protein